MTRVEDFGGAVAAIERGFQKSEIETSAYRVAQEIDGGERTVVGLNRFTVEVEDPYEPLRVDPAIEAQQAERLSRLRTTRHNAEVDRQLDAQGTDNVLPPMKAALAAHGTVGEVCDALRDVWGVYQPPDAF
jgi:methylmalonyl-CoA mutase N-terminal domain/subunit